MPKAARGASAGAKRSKAAAGHKLAPELPHGTLLTDLHKKSWKLGKAVGSGGFGLIYLASAEGASADPQYVIKVEPHGNGPLFCELHFYQRVAKPELISAWLSQHKMKSLGVPKFIATGAHEHNGTRYRFMVMERFGTDLQKLFEQNGKSFSRSAVYLLALRIIDALEYIHEHQYVHADIKASNLLLGYTKGTQDQVYLVDYGLAFRYTSEGSHKDYKEDPKRKHDGTIEFTSRDAHRGVVPSRRGDLEILGYCLLQWLCGRLPWEDNLLNKDYVAAQKDKHMSNIPNLMKACFPSGDIPDELVKYLKAVVDLQYDEKPDYAGLRQLFIGGLKKLGTSATAKIDLSAPKGVTPQKAKKTAPKKLPAKRKNEAAEGSDDEDSRPRAQAAKSKRPAAKVRSLAEDSDEDSDEDSEPEYTPKQTKSRGAVPAKFKSLASAAHSPSPRKAASPAIARVKATINGSKAKPSMSTGTQTSPGLKGLKRSRKYKK